MKTIKIENKKNLFGISQKLCMSTVLLLLIVFSGEKAFSQATQGITTGTNYDAYVINRDNSNRWSYLRLQTGGSNNTPAKAWNILNQGDDLKWNFAGNSNHSNIGTERMRLTTDGKLGIGTTPTAPLHVEASSGTNPSQNGLYVYNSSNSANQHAILTARVAGSSAGDPFISWDIYNEAGWSMGIDNSDGNKLKIAGSWASVSSATAITIDRSSRNVGIGTNNPTAPLHVKASSGTNPSQNGLYVYNSSNSANQDAILTARVAGSSAGDPFISWDIYNESGWSMGIDNSDGNKLKIARSWASVSSATAITIDRLNNVGIGTINPTEKLHVQGGNIYTSGVLKAAGTGDSYVQGNLGIGTANPTEKLEVSGTVKAQNFVSSAASFPDYVFAENYPVLPLPELESYVAQYRHLPNMPAEKEVVEQGLNMPEVVIKSVENIETIYLHLFRMQKEIEILKEENTALSQQLERTH